MVDDWCILVSYASQHLNISMSENPVPVTVSLLVFAKDLCLVEFYVCLSRKSDCHIKVLLESDPQCQVDTTKFRVILINEALHIFYFLFLHVPMQDKLKNQV